MRHQRNGKTGIIHARASASRWSNVISRSGIGVVTNGFSSIIGLAIAVFISHSSGVTGLGEYGLTFAVFGVSLGLSGAVGAMSVLSILPEEELIRRFGGRVSLVGIVCGVMATIIGLVGQSAYLVILGLCLPGMLLHDYARKIKTAIGHGTTSLAIEGSLLVAVVGVAFAVAVWELPPISVFASWCVGSLISGYCQALKDSIQLMPRWKTGADDSKSALIFGVENLSGAGTGHLLIAAISSLFSLNVVGALRGAATVLGPANLVSGTVQPLVLSPLARARTVAKNSEFRRVAGLGLAVTTIVAIVAFPLLLLPDEIGRLLLGAVWGDAKPVLTMLCIECVATAASVVAMAGHRVYGKATRLMSLSLALIPLRICASLTGGFIGGASGIAAGMAAVAILSAASYWISYAGLIRQRSPVTHGTFQVEKSAQCLKE